MRGLIDADEVITSLPKSRQKSIALRGAELLKKVERRLTLGQLRKDRKLSQANLAEALGIGQMQISRLEQRKDPRLSTMKRTVAAMGGHLSMIVTFPDQEPIILVTSPTPEEKLVTLRETRSGTAKESRRGRHRARTKVSG
jgi:transcriptional regulator with XRE-family HTH domain